MFLRTVLCEEPKILKHKKCYPQVVVCLAEVTCRQYANKHMEPVGDIAEKDMWFNE